MEVLSVIQRMSRVVGMATPTAVFASDDRSAQEFAAVANQMAEDIADVYNWPRLRRLGSITGDGVATSHALPADFARFPGEGVIYPADSMNCALEHVSDHTQWLEWQRRLTIPVYGAWTMIGDRVEILPVDTRTYNFYYQSDKIVRSDGTAANSSFPYTLSFELADSDAYGYAQTAFVTDNDHFQLDWRLLERGMIWQWRANKGLPYAEDMRSYEMMLSRRITEAGGQKAIQMGRRANSRRPNTWPTTVSNAPDGFILDE